jgi:hypothetical protein
MLFCVASAMELKMPASPGAMVTATLVRGCAAELAGR